MQRSHGTPSLHYIESKNSILPRLRWYLAFSLSMPHLKQAPSLLILAVETRFCILNLPRFFRENTDDGATTVVKGGVMTPLSVSSVIVHVSWSDRSTRSSPGLRALFWFNEGTARGRVATAGRAVASLLSPYCFASEATFKYFSTTTEL
jgi:hypothetical protein